MKFKDPISGFYSRSSTLGKIVIRHRHIAQVNRFLFVIQTHNEDSAKELVKHARLVLGCQDPQHSYFTQHDAWRTWGLYRPLIDAPVDEMTEELEVV